MTERWRLHDSGKWLTGGEAVEVLRERVAVGTLETWFESSHGRLLAFVTNGARALVMVLDGVGDAGEHVSDPAAGTEAQSGYILSNGQHDEYRNIDTVPLDRALQAVGHEIDFGAHDPALAWIDDRRPPQP